MKSSKTISISLGRLAEAISAQLEGDPEIQIASAAPIESAQPGQIAFLANPKYKAHLKTTKASAVIVGPDAPAPVCAALRHVSPYLAFAHTLDLLYPSDRMVAEGVAPSAVVEEETQIDEAAGIGPLCHVSRGTSVGPGSQLVSSVYLGRDVTVGENCLLYPGVRMMDGCHLGDNVVIHSSTVIGSDGFGYAASPNGLKKVRQVGWVEIDDDVEIGSNVSIDRGALGPTRIGRGTKIDNLVQIAHNVEVGQHCILVSQVGISGSTKLGNGVQLGGQVGIIGHIEIGDGVKVGAQSGVSASVEPGRVLFGSPAHDISATKRELAAIGRLPQLLKRVRALEKKLGE